jgi:hypothetical protein
MGQLASQIENWIEPNGSKSNKNKLDPFDVTNALSPNGVFPPEVADLILEYLCADPKFLFYASISCKLWLQTASFYLKGFRRYKLDPNTPNPRAEILKQQTIQNNIIKGIYWPNLLAKQYMNRRSGFLSFDWSISKNLIAINVDKTVRMSMGPEHLFTSGTILDLGNNGRAAEAIWGAHVIGGIQVVPDRSLWGWNWQSFTCYNENNAHLSSVSCKFKPPVDTSDPYHALRYPARVMTGLHNLDESPTVLVYDRPTQVKENELANFTVEVYHVLTGNLLLERTIVQMGCDIIGYFKHFAICAEASSTMFVDLESGKIVAKFPVGPITQNLFCICDRKIAFATGTSVLVYDWSTGRQITKFLIKGLFDESKYKRHHQEMKIQGIAFDRWKLVLGIGATKPTDDHSFGRFKEGDVVPAFIAIFDMLNDFKLLQRIHMQSTFKAGKEFKIALPPKGSIVVENMSLIEIDFNHPYLAKPIPVAFFNCKQKAMELQVQKVEPMQLTEFVQKKLNCDLSSIYALTYFERDPLVTRKAKQARKFMLDASKRPSNWKSVRITFFFNQANLQNTDYRTFTELGEFMKYYEKMPDTTSKFILASNAPGENDTFRTCARIKSVYGDCVLIFEQYNKETMLWELIEPFAPKGIDFNNYD